MDPRLFSGTLDLMILDVVASGPSYGYEITQTVLERSGGAFELKEGSLYPALHKLEKRGLLESYWREAAEGRRRKYYRLTAEGRKALLSKRSEWRDFTRAVNGVLGEPHAST